MVATEVVFAFRVGVGGHPSEAMTAPPSPRTQRRVLACADMAFTAGWSALPEAAAGALMRAGLHDLCIWAHLVPEGIDDVPGFLVGFARETCGELPAPGQTWDELDCDLAVLVVSAGRAADAREKRTGLLSDLATFLEQTRRRRTCEHEEVDRALLKVEAEALARVPQEWRPRKLRRKAAAENETERADAEKVARHRAATLRKYVRLWRLFRRYLLEHDREPYPQSLDVVLDYVGHQADQGAAMSWFRDFGHTLRFLEGNGEQEPERLLHLNAALQNALEEGRAAAASAAEGQTRTRGGRQAPPLVVALLAALETTVVGSGPDYPRFYAWVRLLKHWASLRWDDTGGLAPDKLEERRKGLYGQPEKTKVSGPGKRTVVLTFTVSSVRFGSVFLAILIG